MPSHRLKSLSVSFAGPRFTTYPLIPVGRRYDLILCKVKSVIRGLLSFLPSPLPICLLWRLGNIRPLRITICLNHPKQLFIVIKTAAVSHSYDPFFSSSLPSTLFSWLDRHSPIRSLSDSFLVFLTPVPFILFFSCLPDRTGVITLVLLTLSHSRSVHFSHIIPRSTFATLF